MGSEANLLLNNKHQKNPKFNNDSKTNIIVNSDKSSNGGSPDILIAKRATLVPGYSGKNISKQELTFETPSNRSRKNTNNFSGMTVEKNKKPVKTIELPNSAS